MPRRVSKPKPPSLPAPPPMVAERGVQVFTPQDIAEVVKYLRQHRGKRQHDLAGQLGVSTTLLRRLENGTEGVRLQSALDALACLGLDVVLVPRDRGLSLQTGAESESETHGH